MTTRTKVAVVGISVLVLMLMGVAVRALAWPPSAVAEVIGHLAWPATALVTLVVLRLPLESLLRKLEPRFADAGQAVRMQAGPLSIELGSLANEPVPSPEAIDRDPDSAQSPAVKELFNELEEVRRQALHWYFRWAAANMDGPEFEALLWFAGRQETWPAGAPPDVTAKLERLEFLSVRADGSLAPTTLGLQFIDLVTSQAEATAAANAIRLEIGIDPSIVEVGGSASVEVRATRGNGEAAVGLPVQLLATSGILLGGFVGGQTAGPTIQVSTGAHGTTGAVWLARQVGQTTITAVHGTHAVSATVAATGVAQPPS